MTTAVLTPFSTAAARPDGKLWRKRVLPVGDVAYRGRMLHFTRAYNDELAANFSARAYDQVPFQLADAANTHTNDPERFRGEVVAMESKDDGLYVVLSASPEGDQILRTNPRLGVSARIVEDYARSDGKHYRAAVQHVLGTLDPRVPGLGAWQAIENAMTADLTIDLTGEQFPDDSNGGEGMPELTAEQHAKMARLLEIPDDKLAELIAGTTPKPQPPAPAAPPPGEDELSDAELEELLAAAEELDAAGLLDDGAPEPQPVGMSMDTAMAIEMANYRADETERQLGVLNAHLDEERFSAERRRLAQEFGIPPYIADLARPLLEGAGHVVELSNGQTVDAGQVMRTVLSEFGRSAQMLDLSLEQGSGFDEPEAASQARTARDDLVTRYRTQTGI